VTTNISSITKASPGVIKVSDISNLANNDWVYISGVNGMTQINGYVGQVTSRSGTNKTFQLKVGNNSLNTSGFSNYSSNTGTVRKCLRANCRLVVTTSTAHTMTDNEYAYITGPISGTSNVVNKAWQIDQLTTTTYELLDSTPANGSGTTGKSFCTRYQCNYYRFANQAGGTSLWKATECAVERTTSTYASKDTAPMTDKVGIQYAPTDGIYQGHTLWNGWPINLDMAACPTAVIQPLTSTKKTLTDLVDTFVADGSTAGHIGFAWAWYMLSPNFLTTSGALGTQWPSSSRPAAYKKDKLVKALILMTDGEFNTYYNSGVPALNSEIADDDNRSPGDGPNGNSLAQAKALCLEFNKSDYKILVYTIGFGITSGSAGDTMLRECATQPSMYKTATDETTLKAAFASIAKSLSELRVSK